jgi:hypothetical protein
MIISFLLMFILQILTPFWWWILVIPFLYGAAFSRSGFRAFLSGMFSAGLLWLLASLHLYLTNAQIVIAKINEMFGIHSPLLLLMITIGIGMACGGFSGSSGYFLKALFIKNEQAGSTVTVAIDESAKKQP